MPKSFWYSPLALDMKKLFSQRLTHYLIKAEGNKVYPCLDMRKDEKEKRKNWSEFTRESKFQN